MEIRKTAFSINEAADHIIDFLINEFNLDEDIALQIFELYAKPYIDSLKDGIYFIAETNYIDKFYRDSYYTFFSKKLNNYKKDCVRISLFEKKIEIDECLVTNDFSALESSYLGFFIIRPTIPQIMGRSVISPLAFKNNNFNCCLTEIHSSVFGAKLKVKAFPTASQDTETISCAETTLWAIMEYFSNKYPEYKPTLPSNIISVLNNVSNERQLPSRGLNIQQISFALKVFGFGSMIYAQKEFADDFYKAINIYLESGIPIILAIDNDENPSSEKIRHALIGIGLKETHNDLELKNSPSKFSLKLEYQLEKSNLKIFDLSNIERDLVVIDDNLPAYRIISKNNPGSNYSNTLWHTCRITSFIVPLHHKINLEALTAKEVICTFLAHEYNILLKKGNLILKTFLASSRSYKDYISKNKSLDPKVKFWILQKPMPKFIYVGETSNKDNYKKGMVNGIVIVDATESNIHNNKPIILAIIDNELLFNDINSGKFHANHIDLQSFECFNYNFK